MLVCIGKMFLNSLTITVKGYLKNIDILKETNLYLFQFSVLIDSQWFIVRQGHVPK